MRCGKSAQSVARFGHFLRRPATPEPIKEWSLTSLNSARTFAEIFSQRYERGSTLEPGAALFAGAGLR